MPKTSPKTSEEIIDQVRKARQLLQELEQTPIHPRDGLKEGAQVRARLNAAKAHILRALEKAQTLTSG